MVLCTLLNVYHVYTFKMMDYKHRYIQSNGSRHELLSCICGYTIRNLKPTRHWLPCYSV